MQPNNTRNIIIFAVATAILLILYQVFVLQPNMKRQHAQEAIAAAAAARAHAQGTAVATAPTKLDVISHQSRAQALAVSPRVRIETPALAGSIALKGGLIDDLYLKDYHTTPDPKSPLVSLFSPPGAQFGYFTRFGWDDASMRPMDADAVWTVASGQTLTPTTPVVLTYANPQGLAYKRVISVDDKYMFTVTDTVTNTGAGQAVIAPYGIVKRQGVPDDVFKSAFNVHQGAVGYLDNGLKMLPYNDWKKKDKDDEALHAHSTGGWLGITDKYWMAALVPDQSQHIATTFDEITDSGVDVYDATFTGPRVIVAPGQSTTNTTRLFAGAKRQAVLSAYEKNLGVKQFTLAIDWGRMFWWLTRPVTWLLDLFAGWVGNIGVAILMLTVVVKLLLFPLANQGFASMSKMKKLQPQIDDLKKRFAGDAQKLQQETMALYSREKINPLAGCLPMFLQFPVFIALLRVLAININMRHAHFLGLSDLSARDPTTIWTLFGLIPWDPATAPWVGGFLDGTLHLGIVAILYGGVMYLQQSLSPPAADPTQQQMMKFMPVIFVFFMARYPVGLMIYWTWSATLTIMQQYFIMHRYKADNPIDDFIAKLRGKPDGSNVEVLPPLDKA